MDKAVDKLQGELNSKPRENSRKIYVQLKFAEQRMKSSGESSSKTNFYQSPGHHPIQHPGAQNGWSW